MLTTLEILEALEEEECFAKEILAVSEAIRNGGNFVETHTPEILDHFNGIGFKTFCIVDPDALATGYICLPDRTYCELCWVDDDTDLEFQTLCEFFGPDIENCISSTLDEATMNNSRITLTDIIKH